MSVTTTNPPAADDRQRLAPKDLLQRMAGGRLYEEAANQGMSLSRFLEREDPSEDYKDGTDAFTRLMREARIKTRSCPEGSYYADELGEFDRTDATRALLPEWMNRQWRQVKLARARPQGSRAPVLSDDTALNSGLRPYADNAQVQVNPLAPAIPLSEVVAMTQPIRGDAYRATYLTESAAATRLVRVTEAAEMPRARLITGEQTIRLYKYGRVLEVSYEALRRVPADMVALYIQLLAVQSEKDEVAAALDVLVNGDGNSGTAATNYNLTTLDSSTTANNPTTKAYLAFKLKLSNPYALTTIITREASMLQLLLLSVGSANVPLVSIQAMSGFGSFRPINPQLADGVAYGITDDAPSGVVVGFDRRFALERLVEIGSNIRELVKWATRQVDGLAMSEVVGYKTMFGAAVKTLTLSA